ncbi:MAG: hypothetical protein IPM85_06180 [Chitinophagaceae bacterium]|nr:hypothetical protein [Chitinophagaceae bacterium]
MSNGNFVVTSTLWDNGSAVNAGAITFVNGTTGLNAGVDNSNSLVGSTTNDVIGNKGITALSNGHFIAVSNLWDNGSTNDAGAVTWCNGTTGITGVISAANSLVGGTASDRVGENGIFVLPDGNYIVLSNLWNNTAPIATTAGAVTWCNGTTGRTGLVSSANSLVGSTNTNGVGNAGTNQYVIITLPNGKYVVRSPFWDNAGASNAGAVTLCNADGSTVGAINSSNSLVGSSASDAVGASGVQVLPNGNYVVSSFLMAIML